MKRMNLTTATFLFSLVLAMLLASCRQEEPEVITPPQQSPPTESETSANPDGLYVYGTNTVATEPGSPTSIMDLAVLDPDKGAQVNSLSGIYGRFIHIGAGSNLQLQYVDQGIEANYGVANGGSLDSANTVGGAINDVVINGSLIDGGDPIEVANEGLYYLYVDVNEETFILMEVKAEIIGDATENEWARGTSLALVSSDADGAVFEASNVPLFGQAGYRYRFNDGWHVFRDDRAVTLSSLGVPSYSVAWSSGFNDLGFHLDNIPNQESGMYTITLSFDATTGEWEETKVRTGDLQRDYSSMEIGWFGNAFFIDDTETAEGAWDQIRRLETPTQEGTNYVWNWTLELLPMRSFVLRENADAGIWVTYGGANKEGSAFTDDLIIKETDQDNYYVVVGGTYEVTFTINTIDEGRTLSIEPQ